MKFSTAPAQSLKQIASLTAVKIIKRRTTDSITAKITRNNESPLRKVPKTSLITRAATLDSADSEKNTHSPSKTARVSPWTRRPDDFIEPVENLHIPTTEEFLRYKGCNEHVPPIIEKKAATVLLKNKRSSKSLQVINLETVKVACRKVGIDKEKKKTSLSTIRTCRLKCLSMR
jgi:hypothetical protein